ncbi:MAG: hypothetical protein J6B95_07060 [Oscillospiraceae bacterium]|nr:hypothetical protein [Oscillospiraceae bacterium]
MPSMIERTLTHARFLAKHLESHDLQCASIAVLVDLGLASHRDGFAYLIKGTTTFTSNPLRRTTKELYALIAENVDPGMDEKKIEQAIRSVITEAWKNRDESVWRIYFPAGRNGVLKKPSNAVFIAQIGYFLILWQGCCRKEASCERE